MFENHGHIHVFAPGQGQTTPPLPRGNFFSLRQLFSQFSPLLQVFPIQDLNSTVAKRGSMFIGLMTSDDAIWFRYQKAVLMR